MSDSRKQRLVKSMARIAHIERARTMAMLSESVTDLRKEEEAFVAIRDSTENSLRFIRSFAATGRVLDIRLYRSACACATDGMARLQAQRTELRSAEQATASARDDVRDASFKCRRLESIAVRLRESAARLLQSDLNKRLDELATMRSAAKVSN